MGDKLNLKYLADCHRVEWTPELEALLRATYINGHIDGTADVKPRI